MLADILMLIALAAGTTRARARRATARFGGKRDDRHRNLDGAAVMKRIGNFMRPLTSLRDKLIKIDAKLVSHSRYTTFQLAEVEARSTSPGYGAPPARQD